MNIFEEYKNKILTIIKKAEKDKLLVLPENLNGVNVDSTPPNIDFDLSTNVDVASLDEIFLFLIFETNSDKLRSIIFDIIRLLSEQRKNLYFLLVNF